MRLTIVFTRPAILLAPLLFAACGGGNDLAAESPEVRTSALTSSDAWGYLWSTSAATPIGTGFVPNSRYSRNSAGQTNTLARLGTGQYRVNFPGLGVGNGG